MRMREVLWALRGHSAALALDFAFTIAVFPSLVADICSAANPATASPCYPRVAAGRLAGARTCARACAASGCYAEHAALQQSMAVRPLLQSELLSGSAACAGAMEATCESLTLACVPASGDLWTPLLFLVFNGGDLLGRVLAGIGPWRTQPLSVGALLAYALSRIVLVVGLLLCHVVTPHPWALPYALRRAHCASCSPHPLLILLV